MSVREAVAAETAATNAAVAAAATAAAAEAAAASKAAAAHEAAAKAAAAANERRALDVRTPSNKPDLPKKNGGGAGLMDGEDYFGGGGVWSGGPGLHPELLPHLGAGCWLLLGSAMGPGCACCGEAGVGRGGAWCQWPRGA